MELSMFNGKIDLFNCKNRCSKMVKVTFPITFGNCFLVGVLVF